MPIPFRSELVYKRGMSCVYISLQLLDLAFGCGFDLSQVGAINTGYVQMVLFDVLVQRLQCSICVICIDSIASGLNQIAQVVEVPYGWWWSESGAWAIARGFVALVRSGLAVQQLIKTCRGSVSSES